MLKSYRTKSPLAPFSIIAPLTSPNAPTIGEATSTPFKGEFTIGSQGPRIRVGLTKIEALKVTTKDPFSKMPIE